MDMIFRCRIISIHSLRMEGDPILDTQVLVHRDFNPLPPHGGRLDFNFEQCANVNISIHSLRMEGDRACSIPDSRTAYISIHSLRLEGDDP